MRALFSLAIRDFHFISRKWFAQGVKALFQGVIHTRLPKAVSLLGAAGDQDLAIHLLFSFPGKCRIKGGSTRSHHSERGEIVSSQVGISQDLDELRGDGSQVCDPFPFYELKGPFRRKSLQQAYLGPHLKSGPPVLQAWASGQRRNVSHVVLLCHFAPFNHTPSTGFG